MKRPGQRYAQHVNRIYRRSGTVCERRFRSCLTQDGEYLLSCYRYIELNPIRAGMVEHPAEYPWSSYQVNGQGAESDVISHHSLYTSLGRSEESRLVAYREPFRYQLDPGVIDEVRSATNGNYVLGSRRFTEQVAEMIGRRVAPEHAGRPRHRLQTGKVR
jgi:putative transposase